MSVPLNSHDRAEHFRKKYVSASEKLRISEADLAVARALQDELEARAERAERLLAAEKLEESAFEPGWYRKDSGCAARGSEEFGGDFSEVRPTSTMALAEEAKGRYKWETWDENTDNLAEGYADTMLEAQIACDKAREEAQ